MPQPIEKQSDRFAFSPHAPKLEDIPDSAYGGEDRPWDSDLDFENMSRGHYNRLRNQHDPDVNEGAAEARDHARLDQLEKDEQTGYNWGPPPSEHEIHDPGFQEEPAAESHPLAGQTNNLWGHPGAPEGGNPMQGWWQTH